MMNGKYFNLIVRADEQYPIPKDRMLEGTAKDVADLFRKNGEYDLCVLSELPTVMTREISPNGASPIARVGYIDVPTLNPQISHPVMSFVAQKLVEKGMLDTWSSRRTRWSVLQGNPFKMFADCVTVPNDQMDDVVNEHQAAVMMPFSEGGAELDLVYQAISKGAASVGLECKRVDELTKPSTITDDIVRLICESRVVIADLSGLNSNVMYEVGFSHGRNKDVILISRDNLSGLPFDIKQWRVINYQYSKDGLERLSGEVAKYCKALQ